MAEVNEENGVIHIYLKESLRVEEKKRKRGRPKEGIPDRNVVSQKTIQDLKGTDFLRKWEALSKVLEACGSFRKAEKWLRKYCPSVPTSRKEMSKILKSHAEMKEEAKEQVRRLIEEAKKNPYLTEEELIEAFETAIKEFTKQKIRQSSPKYPLGTKATDEKGMNVREWKLKKKAQKEKK